MRSIHQLVHTLSYGDAISGEVLALQRCFRARGCESEIYAIHVHPKLKGQAHDYRTLEKQFDGELLLHYSLGSPLNELYSGLTSARRSLVYHNLTPAHWFRSINPRITHDIEQGLRELPLLCAQSDRLIADSRFNAQELSDLGFSAEVLELPIDPARWSEPANEGIAALVRNDPGLHFLHVGRLAPNKCIEDIIKTFLFVKRHVARESTLWLVGIDTDTELYSFALKRLVRDFNLTDSVRFVGCMADSEVRALYENCSAYICMSEHEGFCLPVIEAMHFGLPVVAYASSALPDTVGSGGVLVREKRHPELAELLVMLAQPGELRRKVVDAGRARVASLSFEAFSQRVTSLFELPLH